MRKLAALLLILVLVFGMVSGAMAKKAYTLDIYWIANKDDEKIRNGVEDAVNAYLEELYENKGIESYLKVAFHLIPWDPVWTEQAIGDLLADKKIDLIFTADWEGYVQEILAGKLTPLGDLLEENGQDILDNLPEDFLEGVRYGYDRVIYGIPTYKELCVPTGLIVNKTAAAQIGWDPDKDPVSTTAELEPYLAKYKELFPARYPYLMERGRWADEPWGPDWIGIEGNALAMKMAKNEDGEYDETVYSIYETPEQEEHIRLMRKWAELGYIAPDAATYDYNRIFGTGDFLVFVQPLKGNNIKSAEMYSANKAPYVPEFDFYYAVKNGDIVKVSQLCSVDFAKKDGLGKLCEDKLQNLKYHFAITAAMLARYCIESGMEHETAYSLSDLYIQSCDRCTNENELSGLHRNMSMDYAKRMADLRKNKVYSKQIVLCVNYIYSHLHKKISVEELSEHTGLSQSYLSRLFRKETGESITEYIIKRKIGAAKNMLKYSDYSLSEISATLAFSCQSYFTKIFKSLEGVTPKKYRDMYSFTTGIDINR